MPTSKVPPNEMERVRRMAIEWQQMRVEMSDAPAPEFIRRLGRLEREQEAAGESLEPEFEHVTIGHRIPLDTKQVAQPLVHVHDGKRGLDILEAAMESMVSECRRRGYSWADIALALNVTRQSAWTKYASIEDDES
jgi:hypothetical protein